MDIVSCAYYLSYSGESPESTNAGPAWETNTTTTHKDISIQYKVNNDSKSGRLEK